MLLQPIKRTVAEFILGLTVAIIQILGAEHVELQAQDDGSGRLVNFYKKAGFMEVKKEGDKTRDSSLKQWTRMEGPASAVAQLAPEAWLVDLVPGDFLPAVWVKKMHNKPLARSNSFRASASFGVDREMAICRKSVCNHHEVQGPCRAVRKPPH